MVLAGELVGPRKALEQLDELPEPTDGADERRLVESLRKLYVAYERKQYEGVLTETEARRLREELGWFGRLALAPPEGPDRAARAEAIAPAQQTALTLLAVTLLGLVLTVVGAVGLLVFLILLANGTLRRHFKTGSPHGGIYAETFAVWLLLFVGIAFLAAPLMTAGRWRLLQTSLLSMVSLVALAWPVLRGVPWRQVRHDVGLTTGRGTFREVAFGVVAYVLAVPLLACGLAVMLLILALRKSGGGGGDLGGDGSPAHPLVGMVGDDAWVWVQVFFAASVAAPVVEEILFRGVSYRHLREATRGGGVALSVLASGLLNSFLFAVIHPQGLIAVPVLMGLAVGFSLAREWRGTVIPCVVAHGISNGLVTLLLLLALGR